VQYKEIETEGYLRCVSIKVQICKKRINIVVFAPFQTPGKPVIFYPP